MSTSLVMRAVFAAAVLSAVPAIAGAQAAQTKSCKDGSSSTRSYFACWGHGGVDTAHAAERPKAATAKPHRAAEAVQAGAPRAKHAKPPVRKEKQASAHHGRTAHAPAVKNKKDEAHRGWLPWHHKKAKESEGKKAKSKTAKKRDSSRLPVPERPNGQGRLP